MRSLIIKIFLAYWLAAGVVIIISDFEPHRHIHNPELVDALNASLQMNGREMIALHEKNACTEHVSALNKSDDRMSLAMADGTIVCGNRDVEGARQLIAETIKSGQRMTANNAVYQVIATPVRSDSGVPYVLLFENRYKTALQLYGLLPGYTTICISGVVTLFLAVLVVLPIRRLRQASTQIAEGALDTRVSQGRITRKLVSVFHLTDDLDGLMVDFNSMADRIQSLVMAQRMLLRDISHELRSPLARLNLALGLAREGRKESVDQHLSRIELESSRLNTLIGQILSLAYVENLDNLSPREVFSLCGLVEELLPDVSYEAEGMGRGVELLVVQDSLVTGDTVLLRQALENVVRNAIRYSPPGKMVQIELTRQEGVGGAMAVLCVTDSGPGIPEDQLETIFKPFYRVGNQRHNTQDGYGIGLAIASRAMALHAGTISARNLTERPGLCVMLTLPVVDSRDLAAKQRSFEYLKEASALGD